MPPLSDIASRHLQHCTAYIFFRAVFLVMYAIQKNDGMAALRSTAWFMSTAVCCRLFARSAQAYDDKTE
jgi:uncharacterized MAPEG superfamily protein